MTFNENTVSHSHASKLTAATRRPADFLEITMRIREVTEKTITWDFQAIRQNDGKLAAEGFIKCIAVNSEWKAVNLPPELAKTVQEKGR